MEPPNQAAIRRNSFISTTSTPPCSPFPMVTYLSKRQKTKLLSHGPVQMQLVHRKHIIFTKLVEMNY